MLETVEKRLTEKKGAKKTMTSPAAIFFAKNFVSFSRGPKFSFTKESVFLAIAVQQGNEKNVPV
jgi:hypothetical protein